MTWRQIKGITGSRKREEKKKCNGKENKLNVKDMERRRERSVKSVGRRRELRGEANKGITGSGESLCVGFRRASLL